jgi:serine protease AprX
MRRARYSIKSSLGLRRRTGLSAIAALPLASALVLPALGLASIGTASQRMQVIVMARPGQMQAAERAALSLGGSIGTQLAPINGFVASLAEGDLSSLAANPTVGSVTPDATLHLLSSTYTPSQDPYSLYNLEEETGVRDMWAEGYAGQGIGVALIDSGVTPVKGLDNEDQVYNGPDLTEESQNPSLDHLDTYGHGTFMAGIIAGHDPGVNPLGSNVSASAFLGVAPDSTLVSVKVADSHGITDVSQVIAAIDWVVQHANDNGLNIRVINLSFGTDSTQSYLLDPLCYAVEQAWDAGIVVVVSAGNDGSSSDGLTDPADDPFVVAVGSETLNGETGSTSLSSFSSWGNGTRNPDLLAPGGHVQSLADPGSYIYDNFSSTGLINSRYFRGSGTSEAAAFTSGAAALLVQEHPTFDPDQIKALLVSTADALPKTSAEAQGAGAIDLDYASGPIKGQLATEVNTPQSFATSTGTGSLQGSRGTDELVLRGATLSGDTDIMGHHVNTTQLAADEAAGTAWQGGTFNGSSWSGSSWSGSSWSGSSWSGDDWSGSSWSSDDWSSGSWDGSSWSDASWSGSSWSGATWSSDSWATDIWANASWS